MGFNERVIDALRRRRGAYIIDCNLVITDEKEFLEGYNHDKTSVQNKTPFASVVRTFHYLGWSKLVKPDGSIWFVYPDTLTEEVIRRMKRPSVKKRKGGGNQAKKKAVVQQKARGKAARQADVARRRGLPNKGGKKKQQKKGAGGGGGGKKQDVPVWVDTGVTPAELVWPVHTHA